MTCNIGVIWDKEVEWMRKRPFDDKALNHTYREISRMAKQREAEIFITNYRWYDDGAVEKAYRFNDKKNIWERVHDVEIDVVFDKFKFDEETKELKKQIRLTLPVLNNFELEQICKDKLMSYEKFPEFVPKTVKATEQNLEDMLFDHERVILKPRFDYGGHGVKVIESVEEFEEGENLLLQEFVDSSAGIPELDVEGVHDLRVEVLNGEIVGAYLRMPGDGGWIANISRGGDFRFIDVEEIPEEVMEAAEKVIEEFDCFSPAFYSIDTILDAEGDAHILEFNSKPGLSFHNDREVKKHKQPIVEALVETLVGMCRNS